MDEPVTFQEKVARMRKASGEVNSNDPLVIFLYTLAREEVPTGVMDAIIDKEIPPGACFTNGWLAHWAMDAAERLRPREEPKFLIGMDLSMPRPKWWQFKKKQAWERQAIIYEYGINPDGSPKGAIPLEKFGWG